MKHSRLLLGIAIAVLAPGVAPTSTSAQSGIYQDQFGPEGGTREYGWQINGTEPDANDSGLDGGVTGETWYADAGATIQFNGYENILSLTAPYQDAYLSFTPQPGFIYSLSATLYETGSNGDATAMGFVQNASPGRFIGSTVGSIDYVTLDDNGNLNTYTSAGITLTATATPGDLITLTLNTTGANWSTSVYDNGALLGSIAYTGAGGANPNPAKISAVALGNDAPGGNTSDDADFSLTVPGQATATVNWTDVQQRIDGFGASTAYTGDFTDAQADAFWSVTNGIGLSLNRAHINNDGSSSDAANCQLAQARGAVIWAACWSPPAAWKSNGSVTNGGYLLPAYYQAYADQLADYVTMMKTTYGVTIHGISPQNEPDQAQDYESCLMSGTQFDIFVRDYLAPTFAAYGLTTKIIMPEPSQWSLLPAYADATLTDSNALPCVGVVAAHNYDGGIGSVYSNATNQNKEIWETEVSDFNPFDPGITSGLAYAFKIHSLLVDAQINAWHFWTLTTNNSDNEGLYEQGIYTKRYYCIGNYSKFVRPGYNRIDATATPADGVYVSAYRQLCTGNFVLVAINENTADVTQAFAFNGFTSPSVTPWVTSGSLSLQQQAPIAGGTGFTATLSGSSVTTFVGVGTSLGNGTPAPYGSAPLGIVASGATIMQAEDYDLGGQGTACYVSFPSNLGVYRSDGVDIEPTADTGGGYDVGWTVAGQWMGYMVNVAESGTYSINARVASQSTGGVFHIESGPVGQIGGNGTTKLGTFVVPSTGGWQNWTTLSLAGVPLTTGTQWIRIVQDTSGYNINYLTFTPEPYLAWKNLYFTAAQLAAPAIGGDTASPGGDGIPNLMKYALNLNPWTDGVARLPAMSITASGSNGYLTLTYTHVIAATDIVYTPQVSGDLQTWSSGAGYVATVSVTPNGDGVTETVVAQDLTPIDGAPRFMRLMVTGP